MGRPKHYTPPLSRFNVCALYHQARELRIPMTQLANDLVEAALKESVGWQRAQAQFDQKQEGEGGEQQTK